MNLDRRPTHEELKRAPKALLHDHLDGGLRPQTILDLAKESGYAKLPAVDADSLAKWFAAAADSGSLEKYLETFAHTVGVMQSPSAIARVAREAALDLAEDFAECAQILDRQRRSILRCGRGIIEGERGADQDAYAHQADFLEFSCHDASGYLRLTQVSGSKGLPCRRSSK